MIRMLGCVVLCACAAQQVETVVVPPVPPPSRASSTAVIGCVPALPSGAAERRRALESALRQDAQCRGAYVELGRVLRETGDYENARRNLHRALAIEADDPDVLAELALNHLAVGHLELAYVTALHAEEVDARHAPTQNVLGLIAIRRGEVAEAYRRFVRATEVADLSELWMNRGQIALSVRAYEDAGLSFRRVTFLRPDLYDGWIGLGVAHRGLAEVEEARAAYQRAIALEDARPEAHYNLAVLIHDHSSLDLSAIRDARAHYEDFLSRASGPRWADARSGVERSCEGCRPGRLELLRQLEIALSAPE
ncbi:MAG: tetratricopeptide repeat protein [Myxococcota bacterium]